MNVDQLYEFLKANQELKGYSFNKKLIGKNQKVSLIPVTSGQLSFELGRLRKKLKVRNKVQFKNISSIKTPALHPLFSVRKGPIEYWEKTMTLFNYN